ncbi:putative protein BIG GRAIN 1 [Helianthus annuus]|uniref:Uncharacterized protein n=2 Tax=Helianthus annuus TaxID=4232 RepID=A0A251TS01_HELAN|nr:putative protein BIG GRAIN 1 [Helianthus annuus]KAJ0698702.1 putative protein BIG GRAIN 1 [Helianthus annuus]
MNMPERSSRYQQPPPPPPLHRRKTPSFSSSLLDSILRSIDETNDDTLNQQQQVHDYDHDLMFFASSSDQPKRSSKIQPHLINEDERIPSLRRAIMIDHWMETQSNNNNRDHVSRKYFSSDSSSSGATMSETTETPSTYRSLPNSFTVSRDAVSIDKKSEVKFMKSTRLRAMKIYGDLKKVKQPISPGSKISAFIYSLFASSSSSSSKKAKMEESMQNFRSLKKSRSIKQQDSCTSFSRSCMSKKQHSSSSVKRSVRFYPETDTVILDRKSTHERDSYERRWFAEKNYTKNYKSFMEDDDEDDLFELEIATAAYTQELPVFETTDLRKIRKI